MAPAVAAAFKLAGLALGFWALTQAGRKPESPREPDQTISLDDVVADCDKRSPFEAPFLRDVGRYYGQSCYRAGSTNKRWLQCTVTDADGQQYTVCFSPQYPFTDTKRGCEYIRHYADFLVKVTTPSGQTLSVDLELDGRQHAEPAQQAADQERDAWLVRKGFSVIRIPWTHLDPYSNSPRNAQAIQWLMDELVRRVNQLD